MAYVFEYFCGIGTATYAKTMVEKLAWKEAKERGVDLVVINPALVIGPLLQPTVNASIVHILKYLNGSVKTYANSVQGYVHVRDVALAHIILFKTPSASGLYICAESVLHRGEDAQILAKFFPKYPIPTKVSIRVDRAKKEFENLKVALEEAQKAIELERKGREETQKLMKLEWEGREEASNNIRELQAELTGKKEEFSVVF
ncbi:hypothetical protein LguiB_023097 [Lonicera macranthoides]